jgi:hypothetical protein
VPSAKDVAPFSSNKLATVKKPSSDKRVSFALEEELDDETAHGLLQAQGVTLGESISGVPRLMTDENGVPVSESHTCAAMASTLALITLLCRLLNMTITFCLAAQT